MPGDLISQALLEEGRHECLISRAQCERSRIAFLEFIQRLRESEISEPEVTILVDQDVAGLDVPVPRTLGVARRDCRGEMAEQVQELAFGEGLVLRSGEEIAAERL